MAAKIRIGMSSFGHLSWLSFPSCRKVKKNEYFPEEQATPHFSPDLFCFIWFYRLSVFPLGYVSHFDISFSGDIKWVVILFVVPQKIHFPRPLYCKQWSESYWMLIWQTANPCKVLEGKLRQHQQPAVVVPSIIQGSKNTLKTISSMSVGRIQNIEFWINMMQIAFIY